MGGKYSRPHPVICTESFSIESKESSQRGWCSINFWTSHRFSEVNDKCPWHLSSPPPASLLYSKNITTKDESSHGNAAGADSRSVSLSCFYGRFIFTRPQDGCVHRQSDSRSRGGIAKLCSRAVKLSICQDSFLIQCRKRRICLHSATGPSGSRPGNRESSAQCTSEEYMQGRGRCLERGVWTNRSDLWI